MPQKLSAASIQKHLEIKEIKDDALVLKSGGLRAILMCSSVNFALKSTEEQDALIYKYQEFLNGLDFPVQIMVASRKFNIDPYIQMLQFKEKEQENELLRVQTAEYIDFIKGLTEMANIMTESFYLVVPFNPSPIKIGFFDKLFSREKSEAKEQAFQELKTQLWQRVEFAISGLKGMGIRAIPLNTEEMIELFYKLYNPSAKEDLELKKAKEMRLQ
ncbi:MAG: hypothetical protein A3I88_01885 [Candidatus Portnoybacteria bacterium RIFCSPLOWO2_12_FULL_39_9]|uniref:TraC-like domain-containing protein n=1 Tax=Candidatus Portnoybacteria bacterium RIFCSPHIGHO2_12_FULL_38_9 TaxID=1801997 RepID=A0A1G2FHA8_9BACT|nr:MAG: hypothetical protein A2646_00065 [Candidatus Portnoybacteria bacterium RIFCSPHIGHO2_02_FULL_39_12]OGZ37459.1 MAG: hypothetical protein A3J64_00490 [Candidatus Portnoybacteria bacterium RIFCSPHIGHO2_12_FULL_38_9]OGZ39105.1 MAG: hypothetical protein A3F21_00065 [Candidatus Portnoybacteria bacterium RIFCSPLOWO2_01_FULL_38_39]OGZ40195.1 MAG: hypothetical protein A3I88_01885 [Candidatus Portnoybacteria bacterium RIFCSPLOWO2_12_FULL_39_9]